MADDAFTGKKRKKREKKGDADSFSYVTLDLHRRRRFHKDLYLCHFHVAEADTARLPDWRGHVHLIDLHRLGRHPLTWLWRRTKDLAQLLYSSDTTRRHGARPPSFLARLPRR
jgi:hypothetical protein